MCQRITRIARPIVQNKKVQQSWQTSALAMHLPLARLVSMPVIFCLLPSSSIVILLIFYISEQHIWKWVWIQFTGLTLPLRGTPANNPITLISPVQWGAVFFCRWQSTRSSANFRTVLSESQKHQPRMSSSNQILTQNDNSRSFKVIRFGVNEEPLRGYIVQYNNCGHECEGLEDTASKRSENRHLRCPHTHLMPPLQQTPANIHINLTLPETRFPGLQFCPWQCIGSSSNFRTVLSESQKCQLIICRARNRFQI